MRDKYLYSYHAARPNLIALVLVVCFQRQLAMHKQNCAQAGISGPVVGMLGTMRQANETLKKYSRVLAHHL